jgi:hypothetical protein
MPSTVYAPLADVSTPASAAPSDGVTVTVALATAPPCELDTVPEKVAPAPCAPVGEIQAPSHTATSPAIAARSVFTFSLLLGCA